MVLPVLNRIHWGMGLFCFWAFASFCLVRNDLWLCTEGSRQRLSSSSLTLLILIDAIATSAPSMIASPPATSVHDGATRKLRRVVCTYRHRDRLSWCREDRWSFLFVVAKCPRARQKLVGLQKCASRASHRIRQRLEILRQKLGPLKKGLRLQTETDTW